MPFILGVPAKEMMENDKKLSEKDENEYVSVQGVIDAWIDGEDYITLIDFKTDKKPEDMTDEAEVCMVDDGDVLCVEVSYIEAYDTECETGCVVGCGRLHVTGLRADIFCCSKCILVCVTKTNAFWYYV